MKCVEVYKELYHQEPFDVAFCPYRISPLGAHIDHQYGKINGLAIDKGIHMAYHPKQNGVVELQSLNFPKRAQFFVNAVPEEKQGDWADHLRGAAKMLGEKYRLKVGLSGIIEGSLPIGGLSSSASVIICFLSALCKVNGIHLEPMEMILTAKAAENQYVGVACGKLDQSCEVLSKKNHLLYLDTKDDSYELIPTSEKMKPYKVAIFFSGLERSLKNSKYNLRQDECKAAAYALMGYAGIVNVVGSSIAREADKVFYTLAGPEISVATTKAYSAQLAAMYCLAVQFAKVREKITEEQYSYYISELLTLPEKMQKTLEDKERIQWFAAKYANAHDVFFVGRGIDYAVCLEGSLKLKEISYIHSEAYAAGELKHGTISLIERGTLVIGVLTQSELYEKTISNMLECKSRGAYLMGLTTYGKYEIEDQVNFTVYVPKVDEHFVGSLAVIPLQLLGYYVSVAKGLDVDKPRNLAKSVTVE